jgi:hypothetical protein
MVFYVIIFHFFARLNNVSAVGGMGIAQHFFLTKVFPDNQLVGRKFLRKTCSFLRIFCALTAQREFDVF